MDRNWNLIDANASASLLTEGISADLLEPPVNVMRIALHPAGLATRTINLGEWRSHLLGQLRRQISMSNDGALAEPYRELQAYPCADRSTSPLLSW